MDNVEKKTISLSKIKIKIFIVFLGVVYIISYMFILKSTYSNAEVVRVAIKNGSIPEIEYINQHGQILNTH